MRVEDTCALFMRPGDLFAGLFDPASSRPVQPFTEVHRIAETRPYDDPRQGRMVALTATTGPLTPVPAAARVLLLRPAPPVRYLSLGNGREISAERAVETVASGDPVWVEAGDSFRVTVGVGPDPDGTPQTAVHDPVVMAGGHGPLDCGRADLLGCVYREAALLARLAAGRKRGPGGEPAADRSGRRAAVP